MARLPDMVAEKLSPAQRRVHDAIVSGPRGRVQGPLRVWLTSPDLADKAQALGAFCRFGTSLPARLSELAILVTGAHWQAGFEWFAHAPIALEAGLGADAVAALRIGSVPRFELADEAAVYAFAHELVTRRRVSRPTYEQAQSVLGETAVVELVAILGYYSLVSMTIVAFEIDLPTGHADPFADRPPLG